MKTVLLVLALMLTGCAAEVVSASARTVVIRAPGGKVADAQRLADGECAKQKRFGRLIARPSYDSANYIFDCVE